MGPDFNTLELRIWSLFLDIKCHAKLNLFLLYIVVLRTIYHDHVEAFSKDKSLKTGDSDSAGLKCGLGPCH